MTPADEREQLVLERLIAEAAANQDILKRSQQRELALLNAPDLQAFFAVLVDGLRVSFSLEYVTAVIWDPQHEIRHLLAAEDPETDTPDGVQFVTALTGITPLYDALVRPWTGDFVAADHGLLIPSLSMPGSVAIIPLRRENRLIGSINLGSREASRFQRGQATDFLAHLGSIASFALENSINRARLLRSGFTDVLTGWHNRRYLKTRLQDELARAGRDAQKLACLMLDIDHFKGINDRYGHLAGDAVLREVTHRIEDQIRRSDIATRYGGEEFVILLPNTTRVVATTIAERIRRAIEAVPVSVGAGVEIPVTLSIGLSRAMPGGEARDLKTQSDALIAEADVQLYRAKANGRNQISG